MSKSIEIAVRHEQLLVGGNWVDGGHGRFDVIDPATGDVVGTVADADDADVDAAVTAAERAFASWRHVPARERGRLLLRTAELIRQRQDLIAQAMTSEQGKPLAEALGEVESAASFFEWFGGEAERIYGQVVPPQQAHQRILVLREPVGVAVAITPWNFPAAMLARKIAPALAAGCTSIVKPASATPLTAVEIVRCLLDAGAPAGTVNLITSKRSAAVSRRLFDDARVRKLSFTGSTEVGKELIRLSAENVTRLSLELGGHSPYVIFDDADLDLAADQIIASKFRNSGQTCVCANRAYVQRSAYEELLAKLAERTTKIVLGSGLDPKTTMGPLIDAAAGDKVAEHVRDAVDRGARVIAGGDRVEVDGLSGSFFAPTILADVTPGMVISYDETFGPALAVAPFDTEDEAVELANSTPYGLAAYLHTRDYGRLLRVAERLDFGMVGVDTGLVSAANAPFSGVKESGYGVEGGAFGIDEYLSTKYLLLGQVSA
ncbi:MAG TPA: NAD-dependent succinate-semialdehyde dehydrogenase [Baekduia sp.]|nr:NAD-dependent succinate-semialdehyde dehydrogenase [Baekduia sp.]